MSVSLSVCLSVCVCIVLVAMTRVVSLPAAIPHTILHDIIGLIGQTLMLGHSIGNSDTIVRHSVLPQIGVCPVVCIETTLIHDCMALVPDITCQPCL